MSHAGFEYVYGPVASRRLGRSLGVDLVPFKTCSHDCIYCQLGRTTNKTIERDEYVPVDRVLRELRSRLSDAPRPDFIGLAGSGEPTLHRRLADIIAGIKAFSRVPVAVLTNGSLLWRPEVRADLAGADLVLPSLDAGSPSTFERVNRPHADVSFEQMVDGLMSFSHGFEGKVWLEVFVLGGITDRQEEILHIADLVGMMRIDRVQLNAVSRPPAEATARSVAWQDLERLRGLFPFRTEVIADYRPRGPACSSTRTDVGVRIVALLSRRPCSIEGMAAGLDLRPNDLLKELDGLCSSGVVGVRREGEAVFYEKTRDPI
jgi:wyosine [tRNA(Phe)-imidazoG37] synthetase (radical SAM superfamily)